MTATIEIVPPVAGSLWSPPLMWTSLPRVTEGLGTGSVRPLFRARKVFGPVRLPIKSNQWRRGDLTTGCLQAYFTQELQRRSKQLTRSTVSAVLKETSCVSGSDCIERLAHSLH